MYNVVCFYWSFCSYFLNQMFCFSYEWHSARRGGYTLPPTPNWSPYIFTLVLKVKVGHKKFMLLKINQGFAKTLQVISFKNDLYFLHRRR